MPPMRMPVVKESVSLWAALMVLASEAAGVYFLHFVTAAFVAFGAGNIFLIAAARIKHIVDKDKEQKDSEKRYTKLAFNALRRMKPAPAGLDDRPSGLAGAILEHNKNELTQPEAEKAAEYIKVTAQRS